MDLKKEIPMRLLIAASSLMLLTIPAAAEQSPRVIELTNVPEECHAHAAIPRSATTDRPELKARISVGNCMATAVLRDVSIADDQASIQRLDDLAQPSLAMFDDVIERGDVDLQIIAQHAKADLLIGLQTRMRNTIPSLGEDGRVLASAPPRRDRLEPRLEPWRSDAGSAFDEIALLSDENPQLQQRNPVIGYVVQRSQLVSEGTAVARP
jgi:hypothetical protein